MIRSIAWKPSWAFFLMLTSVHVVKCSVSQSVLPKLTKLEFPRYQGGDDPTSWICRAEQFFEFQQIEPEERVSLAAYHLEGDAQLWYQLLKEEGEVISWALLKEGLHARFGSTEIEDFFGDLTKFRQSSIVREYQTQFEKLLAQAGKLTTPQQVGCFTNGLKEPIQVEVQAARPTTLSAAVGLARLYEAKLASQTKRSFTPAEIEERRKKDLCFHCNDKFSPCHLCKKLFIMEACYLEEDDGDIDFPTEPENDSENTEEAPTVS
ncbi:hypothetical protein F0562_030652 [Nyssa sinensis]|uniref:Retrotransposon gag domain-containing protein n=1 Tax=Nyssa sinensis TaxID=561372 RepID=A0A5J5AZ49_9ASTE|nr:hypothetical protein F0562_030652 [Nyssa sinensis]